MPFRFGPGGGFGGFGGFGGGGFGGGGFAGRGGAAAGGGAGGAAAAANPQNDRIKKRARVVAVADPRTASVVVTASKDMIGQIASMVEQLDQDSPKVAHVGVIHLENADPVQVEQVLQDMFQSTTSSHSSSASQQSPLQTRIQQNTGTATTGSTVGGTGLGNSRPGGGASF
jgi:type II secretory pathway component GspD/PulD (secretin)